MTYLKRPHNEIVIIPARHVRFRNDQENSQAAAWFHSQIPNNYGDDIEVRPMMVINGSGLAYQIWTSSLGEPNWLGSPEEFTYYVNKFNRSNSRRFCFYRRVPHGEILTEYEQYKAIVKKRQRQVKNMIFSVHILMDRKERFFIAISMQWKKRSTVGRLTKKESYLAMENYLLLDK